MDGNWVWLVFRPQRLTDPVSSEAPVPLSITTVCFPPAAWNLVSLKTITRSVQSNSWLRSVSTFKSYSALSTTLCSYIFLCCLVALEGWLECNDKCEHQLVVQDNHLPTLTGFINVCKNVWAHRNELEIRSQVFIWVLLNRLNVFSQGLRYSPNFLNDIVSMKSDSKYLRQRFLIVAIFPLLQTNIFTSSFFACVVTFALCHFKSSPWEISGLDLYS